MTELAEPQTAPFVAPQVARTRSWMDISPSVVIVMWQREMLRFFRDRSQIFGAISRTILWLLILGFGLGAALREVEGYTYAQYVLPGVIVLNVLFASMQSAISLVWDRSVGLLREVMVSPAPIFSVTLGKLFGGASIAVIQGSIPLIVAPFIGVDLPFFTIIACWVVMFFMGILVTSIGVFIASRMRTFEGFGAISNGLIQPLYFLSGSIFPLKGVVGGVGFTQITDETRRLLRQQGVMNLGASWFIELPWWIQAFVYANPVSYVLDLLRYILLDFEQLSLTADYLVTFVLPLLAVVVAAWAMGRMLKGVAGRPMPRRKPRMA
jgi:ABC-2 type transport system permease protein